MENLHAIELVEVNRYADTKISTGCNQPLEATLQAAGSFKTKSWPLLFVTKS